MSDRPRSLRRAAGRTAAALLALTLIAAAAGAIAWRDTYRARGIVTPLLAVIEEEPKDSTRFYDAMDGLGRDVERLGALDPTQVEAVLGAELEVGELRRRAFAAVLLVWLADHVWADARLAMPTRERAAEILVEMVVTGEGEVRDLAEEHLFGTSPEALVPLAVTARRASGRTRLVALAHLELLLDQVPRRGSRRPEDQVLIAQRQLEPRVARVMAIVLKLLEEEAQDPEIDRLLVEVLGYGGAAILPELEDVLRSGPDVARRRAAPALMDIASDADSPVDALLLVGRITATATDGEAILAAVDPELRRRFPNGSRPLPRDGALTGLLDLLEREPPLRRAAALAVASVAGGLANAGDPGRAMELVDRLVTVATEDPDAEVRTATTNELARISAAAVRADEVVPRLIERYAHEEATATIHALVRTSVELAGRAPEDARIRRLVVEALLRGLRGERPRSAYDADGVVALAGSGAVDPLLEIGAAHEDAVPRIVGALIGGARVDDAVRDRIAARRDDPHPAVREIVELVESRLPPREE